MIVEFPRCFLITLTLFIGQIGSSLSSEGYQTIPEPELRCATVLPYFPDLALSDNHLFHDFAKLNLGNFKKVDVRIVLIQKCPILSSGCPLIAGKVG